MKATRVTDERFARWPKVFQRGDEMRIKFRVLTPLRLSVVNELIIAPLTTVWRVAAGAFIVVILLRIFEWANLFPFLPVSAEVLTAALVVPLFIWAVERFLGYPLCRMLVGRNITVKVTLNSVRIRNGLFSFGQQFSRAQRIIFVHENLEYTTQLPIYTRSQYWCIVVGDIRKERLLEVYNTQQVAAFVTNLNVALMLLSHQRDNNLEDDPTERRLQRMRGYEP